MNVLWRYFHGCQRITATTEKRTYKASGYNTCIIQHALNTYAFTTMVHRKNLEIGKNRQTTKLHNGKNNKRRQMTVIIVCYCVCVSVRVLAKATEIKPSILTLPLLQWHCIVSWSQRFKSSNIYRKFSYVNKPIEVYITNISSMSAFETPWYIIFKRFFVWTEHKFVSLGK